MPPFPWRACDAATIDPTWCRGWGAFAALGAPGPPDLALGFLQEKVVAPPGGGGRKEQRKAVAANKKMTEADVASLETRRVEAMEAISRATAFEVQREAHAARILEIREAHNLRSQNLNVRKATLERGMDAAIVWKDSAMYDQKDAQLQAVLLELQNMADIAVKDFEANQAVWNEELITKMEGAKADEEAKKTEAATKKAADFAEEKAQAAAVAALRKRSEQSAAKKARRLRRASAGEDGDNAAAVLKEKRKEMTSMKRKLQAPLSTEGSVRQTCGACSAQIPVYAKCRNCDGCGKLLHDPRGSLPAECTATIIKAGGRSVVVCAPEGCRTNRPRRAGPHSPSKKFSNDSSGDSGVEETQDTLACSGCRQTIPCQMKDNDGKPMSQHSCHLCLQPVHTFITKPAGCKPAMVPASRL